MYRITKGDDMVHQFDHIDMILMHFQSVGDSAQVFLNCLLFSVEDTTVRRRRLGLLCQRNSDHQITEYNRIH